MTRALLDELHLALDQRLPDAELPGMARRFADTRLYVQVSNDPGVRSDQVAFTFDQADGKQIMFACMDGDAARARFERDGFAVRDINGAVAMYLAEQQDIGLAILDGDDVAIALPPQALMLLRQAAWLDGDEGDAAPPPSGTQASIRQYPVAFARWLYDYCRQHPDISSAWLGFLALGGKDKPDVAVALDEYALGVHYANIREHTDLLLAGQVLYGDEVWEDRAHYRTFTAVPPFYSKTDPQGWWARWRRKFPPAPVPNLAIDIQPGGDA